MCDNSIPRYSLLAFQDVRRMGSKALQCNVFPYLLNLMKSAPFATVNVSVVLWGIA